jgi:hypothetical protein
MSMPHDAIQLPRTSDRCDAARYTFGAGINAELASPTVVGEPAAGYARERSRMP